jgi:hypothetical protein
MQWLEGFYEIEHLLCTREWVLKLRPHASTEVRLAALVHDAERHFPGGLLGPVGAHFDDPGYLFAHSIRSAEFVNAWLRNEAGVKDEEFLYRVGSLILRHEVGGDAEADVLQAADSISFLETLSWLAVDWVRTGRYTKEEAGKKHTWMLERIRIPEAVALGLPHYERAIRDLERAGEVDTEGALAIVGDFHLLLGLTTDRHES